MSDELRQIGGWACFYEEGRKDELPSLPLKAGSPAAWIYCLSPDVSSIVFADRFWEDINAELGTLFDRAEEEELEPAMSEQIAIMIDRLAQARYGNGLIERKVGTRSDGTPIMARSDEHIMRDSLLGLVEFLKSRAKGNEVVVASF